MLYGFTDFDIPTSSWRCGGRMFVELPCSTCTVHVASLHSDCISTRTVQALSLWCVKVGSKGRWVSRRGLSVPRKLKFEVFIANDDNNVC